MNQYETIECHKEVLYNYMLGKIGSQLGLRKSSVSHDQIEKRSKSPPSYKQFKHMAKEGPVSIQYKCLVSIYVFPEMKLRGLLISRTELYCSVSQFLHRYCISLRDLYIFRIGLSILLQPNMLTDPGNI